MTILVNLYDLRQNHVTVVNIIIQTIDNSVQIILIIKISKSWMGTLCVISVAASQTRMGARKKPQNSKSTLFFVRTQCLSVIWAIKFESDNNTCLDKTTLSEAGQSLMS